MSDDVKTHNKLDLELDAENDLTEDDRGEASCLQVSLVEASSQEAAHVEAGDSGQILSTPSFSTEAARLSSREGSASERKSYEEQALQDKTYAETENASPDVSTLRASAETDQESSHLRLRKRVPMMEQDEDDPTTCEGASSGVKCEPLASASGASGRVALCHPRYNVSDSNRSIPATRTHAFASVTQPVVRTVTYRERQRPVPNANPSASEDQDNEWLRYELVLEWAEEVSRYVTCFYMFGVALGALLENNDNQASINAALVLWILFYPLIFSYM